MVFHVVAYNSFCRAIYKITSEDGVEFQCILKKYQGRTSFDKPPEELTLFKCGEGWKSDKRSYRELTRSLGASIEEKLIHF